MKNYYIFTIQNLIMDYTGHKINKYQVIRLIGEGGMASVYEAKHEILGTKVAIKILNPILSANKQIRERFLNEAKMMASFQHPNITNIIDFEEN
jgi:serine/threonine-protein kinase